MPRRRTKADYLDIAVTLANDRPHLGATPYAYAVAHVDMAQVAAVAGVSRTALYRLWETQESFRADLTAYLAAMDDAPWMELNIQRFATRLGYPDEFRELARQRLNADQDKLGTDPRPLLRAGIAGYPDASDVTAVIAERERWRLDRHAVVVDRALRSTGRRCLPGLQPLDISVVVNCLADGLAIASRITPPDLPLVVEDSSPEPWSLFALAVCGLFDRMSEPDPARSSPEEGTGLEPAEVSRPLPAPLDIVSPQPTGRRLHYLRVAAELASSEPPAGDLSDSCAVGYVGLDALARAEGVTRAAVRKLWPAQAMFRLDLFTHLLSCHRQAVTERLRQAPGGRSAAEVLLEVGDDLFAHLQEDLARVNHLTFAPQFVLPAFRSHIHHHIHPLLASSAAALAQLLAAVGLPRPAGVSDHQLAVTALALVDGMTRVVRTLPDVVRTRIGYHGSSHSLLAVALACLLNAGTTRDRDRSREISASPVPVSLCH